MKMGVVGLWTLLFVAAAAARATQAPDPCATGSISPQFHITGMGIGPHDANAIFQYKGMWHAMHQANWTDWAHLVSNDMVHWTRLESALFPNGDWDGSLTLLDGKPVIMYDCFNLKDCLPANATPGLGDNPLVGVARPVDLSDQNLTTWNKDPHNPIYIQLENGEPVSRGFAGYPPPFPPFRLWPFLTGFPFTGPPISGG
jgi:hypothetical protein